MAGNARGQLKEQMEGIARNLIWVVAHCDKGLEILGDTHPEIQDYFHSLKKEAETLNEIGAGVYATI